MKKFATTLTESGREKVREFLANVIKEPENLDWSLVEWVKEIEGRDVADRGYEVRQFESKDGRPHVISFAESDWNYEEEETELN